MAIVTEYKCMDCELKLVDDGRAFIWNERPNETYDFLILMRTCGWLDDAKISGRVSETYCSECDRFVRVYSIREVHDSIEDPCKVVMDGIKNYIDKCGRKLEELKEMKNNVRYSIEKEDDHYVMEIPEWDFTYANLLSPELTKDEFINEALGEFNEELNRSIGKREEAYLRYLNSNYLVIDETGRPADDYNPLEKVKCPVCGKEIHRYVNGKVPCPRCGGHLLAMNSICYD